MPETTRHYFPDNEWMSRHTKLIPMRTFLRRLFFQFWYYRNPPWDTGISPPELMEHIRSHSPGRALDMGCGTGTNVITLAQHGWQVTGIDFAWRAIRVAEAKIRQAGVQAELLVGDVTQPEQVDRPFDLVLDIGCFHSLPAEGRARYAANLTGLLAPGGTFLMYAFFKEADESGSGLTPEDVFLIAEYLSLVDRQDGTERGRHPSAWFTFQLLDGGSTA